MKYYGQALQDKWVYETIGTNGIFVDVGAYDGIQTSNTYLLENLGWNGICIEANPLVFESLTRNRRCTCINKAVTNYQGKAHFGIDRIAALNEPASVLVLCDTLNNILKQSLCPKKIDYLSMDIEGHELTVLREFPFAEWDINLITIEHNLYLDGPEKKDALFALLTAQGFIRTYEDVKCLDTNPLYFNQPYEDWYVKKDFIH
jgi:FkbM family methyltransferase